MNAEEKSIRKSISDELAEILPQLSADQVRFVVARQEFSTDSEAAEAIKIKPNTVYNWPKIVKRAVHLVAADGLTTAMHIRRRNLVKAMQVKAAGLDSGDERLRQSVASEFVEWELGKAKQPIDIDISNLTEEQLERIASGENPLQVITTTSSGGRT